MYFGNREVKKMWFGDKEVQKGWFGNGLFYSGTNVFGVMWDYSKPSTALTRLTSSNDPHGLVNVNITTNPVAAVGTGSGSSPFDDYAPWSGMEEYNIVSNAVSYKKGTSGFSRTGNDTVVYIPTFYYRIVDDAANSRRYFYIAEEAVEGFSLHPGSGKYVGRYNTGTGHVSKSGLAPQVNQTRTWFRSGATGKGAKWCQYDYASWCAVWLLYLVEFADWNSQACIAQGYVNDNSAAINSGGTDTMTYHTGRAAGTNGKTAIQYRHIENPWGNVYEYIDGINFHDKAVYICTTRTNYADDRATNYTSAGITLLTSGWITRLGMSSAFPWAFLPIATGGSEATYIPDFVALGSGWTTLNVGGDWNYNSRAGLFGLHAASATSSAYNDTGSRLLFNP